MPSTPLPLTPWNRDTGTNQARILPKDVTPFDGQYVFCLGYDEPGQMEQIAVGDYVEAKQTGVMDNINVIRPRFHFRGPTTQPLGTAWEVSLLLDGFQQYSRRMVTGDERGFSDMGLNVSKVNGTHEVCIRLTLVSA